ncbi:MAG: DUF2252 domain-containing protein [Thermoleophilia bacterium]|nr:DUF2252 domain-containing protein [Thermoleophilia bacterium]
MDDSLLTHAFWRPRASRRARREAGRSRREDVPLESQADLALPPDRPSPVDTLGAQDANRLPELVPIRYGRMSATPFTFLRGAAAVMANDLAAGASTDMRVQLCGDAHLSNFGLFNAPDRRLVFDINDFDETLPGPFEWDLKRLAASVTVAARNNGLSPNKAETATAAAVAGYRQTVARAADHGPLDVFYYRLDASSLAQRFADRKPSKRTKKAVRKAARKTSARALDKLTDIVDGRRVIVPDPPLISPIEVNTAEELERVDRFVSQYRESLPLSRRALLDRFTIVDIAHKVVGVGSVGTRCLIALLESADGQPLFLQLKEAVASVLEPYAGSSKFANSGQRVVEGQRLTQAAGDVFLGWARGERPNEPHVDFYVRQLWDGKGSFEVEEMGAGSLRRYARFCGAALGLAHARSGDAATISGYLGDDETFDEAIVAFADSYADLNESDYGLITAAIDQGDITVIRDL